MTDDEVMKLLDEAFARQNPLSNVSRQEACKPTTEESGVAGTKHASSPSAELQEWLKTRENLLKIRASMSENGDHIMLKDSLVDPMELPEPLRTEAIEYLLKRDED